jgi:outer membrane protein
VKKYLVAVLVLFGVSAMFAQTTQKLAYVDMSKISEQLPAAIKAKADLEAIGNKWQAELDSMNTELQEQYGEFQKKVQAYQEKAPTMSKAQKDKQEKELKEQQKTFVEKDNSLKAYQQEKFAQGTGEYYKKQEELLKPIRLKIADAIKAVCKDEGVQFVFDKSGDLVLPYADPAFDLTYKVLDKLTKMK